ncbi:anoctamin-7-like isoform X3 [Tigriopus californicus]|uniref:anoctamin-7-like isoform X3 n=1 Tax=Tigriopus californicus TaxID=6832 RepID=UPI0027DA9E91|nr:anoctamin-7-like isoform X3 [Tigriopus californicus]
MDLNWHEPPHAHHHKSMPEIPSTRNPLRKQETTFDASPEPRTNPYKNCNGINHIDYQVLVGEGAVEGRNGLGLYGSPGVSPRRPLLSAQSQESSSSFESVGQTSASALQQYPSSSRKRRASLRWLCNKKFINNKQKIPEESLSNPDPEDTVDVEEVAECVEALGPVEHFVRQESRRSLGLAGTCESFDPTSDNILGFAELLHLQKKKGLRIVQNATGLRYGVDLDLIGGRDDITTYFSDEQRKIDFVLVYEERGIIEEFIDPEALNEDAKPRKSGMKKKQKFSLWRQKFMASIHAIGLESEEEIIQRPKNTLHFIRLHAPWPLLCRYAEELNLRAPIQEHQTEAHPNPSGNWSEWMLSKLRLPNVMFEEVPNKPLDYYTCPFKTSKVDKFLGSEDPNSFFSRAQRSRMVWEILATAPFGKEKKGEVGVERLVDEGAFSAAFPLHDGRFEHPGDETPENLLNTRQILSHYWAAWGKWYKYQPLDHIREYFGEKIAIYFAWLGFYTGWLLPAAVVGVLVFLYGVLTMNHNTIALETCNNGDQFTMCPLCEECDYWKLSDICLYKKIAYLFDHPGTVFYAIFMSFWAVTFLEYWKRKSASLAHHWDCMGFQEEEERPRPDFAAKAPYLEKNPITGVREPSFPQSKRYKRIAAGTALILLMISLVLIFILAVIIYRTLVSIPLFQNETLRPMAQVIASMSGAMVNLILIMSLGRVYEKLALRLTTWEMHRTQSEFDDNLTFKVFIFQFINFYSSIFYIAFFKGRFVGYPGHYKHIFGNLRNEDCSNGGCLIELAQQLAVIMVGKQMINNAQEVLIPKMKAWWHHRKSSLQEIGESQMERDYKLVENEGLFQEYLEMVLQFGFITIFVAAFPLAPFFALLNNWVEIRLDAQKFVCETRRAVAERAENIGIWFKILDMLAQFAVITNAFLIAFTSEFIPKLVYKYEHNWNMRGYVNFTLATSPAEGWMDVNRTECRYRAFRDTRGTFTPMHWKILALKLAFVIIFEHIVFGVCRLIDLVVPDIPESLDIKIKRERFLAKEALQEAEHVLQKVLTDHHDDSDRRDSSDPDSPLLRRRN